MQNSQPAYVANIYQSIQCGKKKCLTFTENYNYIKRLAHF